MWSCATKKFYLLNTKKMRLALLLSLLITALNLSGQSENEGKFYLSGNTSLTYSNNFKNTFEQASFEAKQFGYFFTNRLMIGAEVIAGTDEGLYDNSPFVISPFLRYYLPINRGKKTQFFAELGIGLFGNFGFGSSVETDLYLGVGAERSFGDGVVGTARLRYKANAWGLNFTELDLGLNFILGGKQAWGGFAAQKRGTFLVDPNLGRIGFGHRGRDNTQDLRLDLNVGVGYFFTEHLFVEAGYDAETMNLDSDAMTGLREFNSNSWQAFLGLRYFLPTASGRLQPFIMASAGWAGASSNIDFTAIFPQPNSNIDPSTFSELGAGTLYMLTKKAALDVGIRYQSEGLGLSSGGANAVVGSVGLKVFLGHR
jgi:hypothetical protein